LTNTGNDGARNSIAVHASRGCGKTYLLNEIPGINNKLKYIKIDGAAVYNSYNFFLRMAEELDCYPVKTEDWQYYADALFSHLEYTKKRYVFLIDNFHKLNYIRDNLIAFLRSKYMTMNNIIFIITLPSVNLEDFDYSHPFFAHFIYHQMEHLEKTGMTKFIEIKFNIKDETIQEAVYSLTEGNLLISNMLCEILALNRNVMDENTTRLFKDMLSRIYVHNTQRRAILETLVEKPKSLQMIIKELNLKSGTVNSHLKRLVQDDYIYRSGTSKYKIRSYIKISLG
jgi:hypothetical protein